MAAGSTISTDEHRSYQGLKHAYDHGAVNHSAKEYVRGIHHVNSLESHWSLLKRADQRHACSHFEQARLEIRERVQLSPQHAALALVDVQSFCSRFRAAALSRDVKSSRCLGFSCLFNDDAFGFSQLSACNGGRRRLGLGFFSVFCEFFDIGGHFL